MRNERAAAVLTNQEYVSYANGTASWGHGGTWGTCLPTKPPIKLTDLRARAVSSRYHDVWTAGLLVVCKLYDTSLQKVFRYADD